MWRMATMLDNAALDNEFYLQGNEVFVCHDWLDQVRVFDSEQERTWVGVRRDHLHNPGRKTDHHITDQTNLTIGLVYTAKTNMTNLLKICKNKFRISNFILLIKTR